MIKVVGVGVGEREVVEVNVGDVVERDVMRADEEVELEALED